MEIDNVQAIRFCNEVIRPLADQAAQLNMRAISMIDQWFAQELGNIIPNDTGQYIMDGSDSDGRPIMSGADVVNLVTFAMGYRDDLAASGNAKLNAILAAAVNILPRL